MRSAWRSTQALPAKARTAIPTQAAPGQHQHEAQTERQRRERHRRSDEHRDQRRGQERRRRDAGQQQRKRYGGVQSHQRGERGRREDRRRHHVEHEGQEQSGRTVEQIERAQAHADQHRHDQHGPDRGREQEPRFCKLRPQRARIDAQEGEAKQQKNGLGKERPDQRAERRQRDPEQDRNRDGIGAVTPEPGESRCRPIEKSQRSWLRHNSRAGSRRVRRLHIGFHVGLEGTFPWPEPMQSCWAPASSARRRRCISPSAGWRSRWSTAAAPARKPPTATPE